MVLAFIEGNFAEGYANISKVIHNESYRVDLLETLGLQNILFWLAMRSLKGVFDNTPKVRYGLCFISLIIV